MSRNFAQIVFLIFALALISVSRQVIARILAKNVPPQILSQKKHGRGVVNKYCYLTLKSYLTPYLFWVNLASVLLFALCAVLQLLLGWFAFFAMPMKILNSLVILCTALESASLSLIDNRMKFGSPFVLYRATPDSNRVFASTIADVVFFVLLPVLVVLCNFLAL